MHNNRTDTEEMLVALAALGYHDGDRARLCFACEASTVRDAVSLADDLRGVLDASVRLGPRPAPLGHGRRWEVTVRTPPVRLEQAAIAAWEERVIDAAGRRGGCAYLGWRTLIDVGDVKRRAVP